MATKKETEVKAPAKKATNTKANAEKVEKMEEKVVKMKASEVTNEFLKALTVENVATEVKKINLGKNGRPYLEKRMVELGISNEVIEAFRNTKGTYIAPSRRNGVVKRSSLDKVFAVVKVYCGDDATEDELKAINLSIKNALSSVITKKEEKEANKEKKKKIEKIKQQMKKLGVKPEEVQ